MVPPVHPVTGCLCVVSTSTNGGGILLVLGMPVGS